MIALNFMLRDHSLEIGNATNQYKLLQYVIYHETKKNNGILRYLQCWVLLI